jgi:hypothetical protein
LGLKLGFTLPENIRKDWKGMTVTNTPAYCDTELIKGVKCVIVQAPEVAFIVFVTCEENKVL